MKRALRVAIAICAMLIILAVLLAWNATRPPAIITIAPDTTYITGPIRPDGYVDYVAALNQRNSESVTPANNSAVLFWQAMGPSGIGSDDRIEFFRMMGIPPLPDQGDYFVPSEKYIARLVPDPQPVEAAPEIADDDPISQQLGKAIKRPWPSAEFPLLADWLAANEKQFDLLIKASLRPRRYDPMISADATVMAMMLPALSQARIATEALTARAMLRASDARFELAWQDLSACHRLARLFGQGPTLVEAIVADSIEGATCAADQGLLQSTSLTAAQAATMRADLDALTAMPASVDKIDTAERFMYLGAVLSVHRELSESTAAYPFGIGKLIGKDPGKFDWDVMLRLGNSWYGKGVAAGRQSDRTARLAAVRKIRDDLDELANGLRTREKGDFTKAVASLFRTRQAASESMGTKFVDLLLPAFDRALDAEDRAAMQLELIKLACNLAAYRADHGAYPENLSDLMPDYVARIPDDIFSGAELNYTRQGDGYFLNSVGVNGIDDGGKSYDDRSENGSEDWDDLSVRIPAAKN